MRPGECYSRNVPGQRWRSQPRLARPGAAKVIHADRLTEVGLPVGSHCFLLVLKAESTYLICALRARPFDETVRCSTQRWNDGGIRQHRGSICMADQSNHPEQTYDEGRVRDLEALLRSLAGR